MRLCKVLGKGYFFALSLIFLFSCATPCAEWQLETVASANPLYNSGMLTYPVEDEYHGLAVTIMHNSSGMRMYLDAYTLTFPVAEGNSDKTSVTIEATDEPSFTVLAERLAGGQRLLLPDEAAQEIVRALLENREVYVKAGRYQVTMPPTDFRKLFEEFSELRLNPLTDS